jgi:hypothetical protein
MCRLSPRRLEHPPANSKVSIGARRGAACLVAHWVGAGRQTSQSLAGPSMNYTVTRLSRLHGQKHFRLTPERARLHA